MSEALNIEESVQSRYAGGAREREEALCCPVDYSSELLAILPQEMIEKDYGCGDPSRYVQEGDIVLDLGSGGGKICYMSAQLVGDQGRVIGVDMTDDMLALADKYKDEMAQKIGGDRVEFHKGFIQDLALNVTQMTQWLSEQPVVDAESLLAFKNWQQKQKQQSPLIESDSVSLVISNCVLNLVDKADRAQMIKEIFRVLQPGGRVAISDIICDEQVPSHLQDDAELWSGCLSGAFEEQEFINSFIAAGFTGVGYDKWDVQVWQIIEGIEFRSVTLVAVKPYADNDYDAGQALMYKGPFAKVEDDQGRVYEKGVRKAVSKNQFHTMMASEMKDQFIAFEPAEPQNLGEFNPCGTRLRPASETKNGKQTTALSSGGCC